MANKRIMDAWNYINVIHDMRQISNFLFLKYIVGKMNDKHVQVLKIQFYYFIH